MALRGRGRRLLVLAGVTALCVPLALLFLFNLYWVYPSKNGYPGCDPDFQPWCEHDPFVTVSWFAGVGSGVAGVLCLVTAYVLPMRFQNWWMWALAAPTLLSVGIVLLGSTLSG